MPQRIKRADEVQCSVFGSPLSRLQTKVVYRPGDSGFYAAWYKCGCVLVGINSYNRILSFCLFHHLERRGWMGFSPKLFPCLKPGWYRFIQPGELPSAYLAGPLGFSEVGRLFHETKIVPLVQKCGFKILDPWKLTPREVIDPILRLPYGGKRKKKWEETNPIIGGNNACAIEIADIIVAELDGTDVDSGTASEVGYGCGIGKPTVGYRGDFRLSADNEGSIVNLQVEWFIRKYGGEIVTNLVELRKQLIYYRNLFRRTVQELQKFKISLETMM